MTERECKHCGGERAPQLRRLIDQLQSRVQEAEALNDAQAEALQSYRDRVMERDYADCIEDRDSAFEAGFYAGIGWYEHELACIHPPHASDVARARKRWESRDGQD